MNPCGYILPIKQQKPVVNLPVSLKKDFCLHFKKNDAPFISFSEDAHTVKLFVEALSKCRHDDAKAYISKHFAKDFDLEALSGVLCKAAYYKNLTKVNFAKTPGNCTTNAILILNSEGKRNSILHLHLIKEPDYHSKWKIYGFDKE